MQCTAVFDQKELKYRAVLKRMQLSAKLRKGELR